MRSFVRFFPEPPLRGARFGIRGYGIREGMAPGSVNRPHGTGDYLIMYFHTRVRVGCSVDAEWAAAGTIFIWAPGDHQFYGDNQRRYVHSWLHCDGSTIGRRLQKHLRRPLPIESPRAFLQFLGALHEEIVTHRPPDEIIAENLFENWARDLDRQLAGHCSPPERLNVVREFMDTHYNELMPLGELARMAHWSAAHFSEEFRRHFGTSPIDYVIRQRMNHACYLLRDVNLTVAEVARRVGYEDQYHFSKLFKRHCGLTPGAIRAKKQLIACCSQSSEQSVSAAQEEFSTGVSP